MSTFQFRQTRVLKVTDKMFLYKLHIFSFTNPSVKLVIKMMTSVGVGMRCWLGGCQHFFNISFPENNSATV